MVIKYFLPNQEPLHDLQASQFLSRFEPLYLYMKGPNLTEVKEKRIMATATSKRCRTIRNQQLLTKRSQIIIKQQPQLHHVITTIDIMRYHLTTIYSSSWRCPWCNGYRRRKWTRRHEFKPSTRLIAFHIALILLGKV